MPIEPPVHVVAVDVVKRIRVQFTPLDVEPGSICITNSVGEVDTEFSLRDDVVVRRFLSHWFQLEPEGANPLECRKIDWPEFAGPVRPRRAASCWLASP